MTFNMTERDKKLLIILAFFLIIVGGGAGILMPVMDAAQTTAQQLEEAMLEQLENQQKVATVPLLEKRLGELETALEETQRIFYESMPSKDIDKMLTGMAVGYSLYVQDLSISMPGTQYAGLQDYPAMLQQKLGLGDGAAVSGELMYSYPGVFSAGVSMVMNGSRPLLQAMVDDLAGLEPKLRITGLNWQKSSRSAGDEEYTLSLTMEIYMYQNLQEYLEESLQQMPAAAPEAGVSDEDGNIDEYMTE